MSNCSECSMWVVSKYQHQQQQRSTAKASSECKEYAMNLSPTLVRPQTNNNNKWKCYQNHNNFTKHQKTAEAATKTERGALNNLPNHAAFWALRLILGEEGREVIFVCILYPTRRNCYCNMYIFWKSIFKFPISRILFARGTPTKGLSLVRPDHIYINADKNFALYINPRFLLEKLLWLNINNLTE